MVMVMVVGLHQVLLARRADAFLDLFALALLRAAFIVSKKSYHI